MRRRSDGHPYETARGQRAFISYSWNDKPLARRIARRLGHRGVGVWIDEVEMQGGDHLPDRLADEIRGSSHLVVVLTADAVKSTWVSQEIEVARGADVAIVPLVAETDLEAPQPLDKIMDIKITDPLTFEARVDVVASILLGRPASKERDCPAIRRDLAAIGRETPELCGLIDQLDRGELSHPQAASVRPDESLRHPAETAFIALHECADDQRRIPISLVAAEFYRQCGIGYAVLERQIELEPAGSEHLHTILSKLCCKEIRKEDLDGVFRLFELASSPQDAVLRSLSALTSGISARSIESELCSSS